MKSIQELENSVLSYLENNLDSRLTYHCVDHTKWVLNETQTICDFEGVDEYKKELACIAALCHEVGFVDVFDENEKYGAAFAKKLMEKQGYSASDIEIVVNAILETDPKIKNVSKISKMLSDADLGYLGTKDYFLWSERLLNEYLSYKHSNGDEKKWLKEQIEFLKIHKYYSQFSILNRKPKKEEILFQLQRQLEKLS